MQELYPRYREFKEIFKKFTEMKNYLNEWKNTFFHGLEGSIIVKMANVFKLIHRLKECYQNMSIFFVETDKLIDSKIYMEIKEL